MKWLAAQNAACDVPHLCLCPLHEHCSITKQPQTYRVVIAVGADVLLRTLCRLLGRYYLRIDSQIGGMTSVAHETQLLRFEAWMDRALTSLCSPSLNVSITTNPAINLHIYQGSSEAGKAPASRCSSNFSI